MSFRISYFFFFFASFIFSQSCCKPGTGGEATLMIYPQHHGVPVLNHIGYSDTVFIKYDAVESPGLSPSNYDTYFVGIPPNNYVHCDKLKCGRYYIYVVAMDSSGPYRVTGGMGYKINFSQRKQMIPVNVAITE